MPILEAVSAEDERPARLAILILAGHSSQLESFGEEAVIEHVVHTLRRLAVKHGASLAFVDAESGGNFEPVLELLNALAGYCQRHPREGARGFLDGLVLEQEREEEKEGERSGVTLITLHAAKGLEFH